MKKVTKSEIKQSLLEQIQLKNGDVKDYYSDLVSTYLELYDIRVDLRKDIKSRGVKVEYQLSTGIKRKVTNESVQELMDVQNQMLTILEKLGIKPGECAGGAGIDNDM